MTLTSLLCEEDEQEHSSKGNSRCTCLGIFNRVQKGLHHKNFGFILHDFISNEVFSVTGKVKVGTGNSMRFSQEVKAKLKIALLTSVPLGFGEGR